MFYLAFLVKDYTKLFQHRPVQLNVEIYPNSFKYKNKQIALLILFCLCNQALLFPGRFSTWWQREMYSETEVYRPPVYTVVGLLFWSHCTARYSHFQNTLIRNRLKILNIYGEALFWLWNQCRKYLEECTSLQLSSQAWHADSSAIHMVVRPGCKHSSFPSATATPLHTDLTSILEWLSIMCQTLQQTHLTKQIGKYVSICCETRAVGGFQNPSSHSWMDRLDNRRRGGVYFEGRQERCSLNH